MFPDQIFYEPDALSYPLGKQLQEKFSNLTWTPIESHNKIDELRTQENKEFPRLKQHVIIGVRKTHKYTENHKVSDYLVPYTSSGCSAMCLYCYLVCNYNKCSYLRLFVNREIMLERLMKKADKSDRCLTFEIGSNSDLILENTLTGNLEWTIRQFADTRQGKLTFPTKFDMVGPLLSLNHREKVIFRMSLNPDEIIRKIEIGTSMLENRINALNEMCEAGYPVGILIAPVILLDNWKELYRELFRVLADTLSPKVRQTAFAEVIFMTYSFVHHAINSEAFPGAVSLYERELMQGRGRGRYLYKEMLRKEGEEFLRELFAEYLPGMPILYIV